MQKKKSVNIWPLFWDFSLCIHLSIRKERTSSASLFYRPKGTAKHPAIDNIKGEYARHRGAPMSPVFSIASLNEFGRYSETRMEHINTLVLCSFVMLWHSPIRDVTDAKVLIFLDRHKNNVIFLFATTWVFIENINKQQYLYIYVAISMP